jgi:two-component system, NtrC family, sensor kinase
MAVLVFVALLVIVLGGAGLWIWLDRVNTLREAHLTTLRLVHVLSEQTERTVQAVDLMLAGLADTLTSTPDLPKHDPAFQDKMWALERSSAFVRGLYVTGPDGFLTHATGHPNSPRVSAADRDYFMAHAARDDLGLFVGKPLKSRRVGTWFIGLSRRLASSDGSFAGVVVAAVEPRYFERFYGDLALGETGSIALFRRDGILIARHPHIESAVGTSYASYEPFMNDQLKRTSTGSLETSGAITGSARVVAYSTVEGTPLVVGVGLDKGTVLADWQQRALVTLGSAFGIALLGAASLILLIQRCRQRAVVEQQLAQAQKLDAAGQMAAGIVHDFRNLLAVVAIGAGMLRKRVDTTLEPILDELDAVVERGTTLSSKLLSFSRQQELELEVVDVNQLLVALQPLLKSATGSGVRLQLRLAPELWPCRLDRTQFDRALLNLFVNARDAMPDGGEVRIATANASCRAGLDRAVLPRGGPLLGLILLAALIGVPLLEIALFIEIGGWIGLGPTLALIVLTAVIGAWKLPSQGIDLLMRARRQLAEGTLPAVEVFEGLCLAIAGALLLAPGFLTDAVGALMLVPAVRRALYHQVRRRIEAHIARGADDFGPEPGYGSGAGPTIETECKQVGEERPGPSGDYVRVTVADNGPGMTPEIARRALEPFFTTKGAAGTGLGLSQVYGLVRQVGGDLHIHSEPGAGTTIELFFPRCAPVRPRPAADHEEVAHGARHRHCQPGDLRSEEAGGRDGQRLAPPH